MATTQTKSPQADPPVKALRTAKGKKPQYFSDPAIDKLLSIVISMAGELSVARERLDTVERLLEEKKILTTSEIDRYQPSEEVAAVRARQRAQFIETLLRVVEAEFEEITGPDMPGSREEILKSLT
jgi:peptidoglycan hydrolase-like protein with peptidoglycan-binding domain